MSAPRAALPGLLLRLLPGLALAAALFLVPGRAAAGPPWNPCEGSSDPCCTAPCSPACGSYAAKCANGCPGIDPDCCFNPCGAACSSYTAKCQAACPGIDLACCFDPCGAACTSIGAKCEAGCSGVNPACCTDPCGAACTSYRAKCEAGCGGTTPACCTDPCGPGCTDVGAKCEAGCSGVSPVCCATRCDDGDPCTDDRCIEGVCVNTPKNCDDEDSCTRDFCEGGECRHEPITVQGTCSAFLGNVVACPGETVQVPNSIRNTGECPATFAWTLSKTGGAPVLSVLPLSGSVTLDGGEEVGVNLPVTVGSPTPRGTASLLFNVMSNNEPACSALANLTVPPKQCTGIPLTPVLWARPGQSVQMRFQIWNTGQCRESYVWSVLLSGPPQVVASPTSSTLPPINPGGVWILFPTLAVAGNSPGGTEQVTVVVDGGCILQGQLRVAALDLVARDHDEKAEEKPGAFVGLNDDDDDGDGRPDLSQPAGTAGEDDLMPLHLRLDLGTLSGGTVELTVPEGAEKVRIYETAARTGRLDLPRRYEARDLPRTLYVEGYKASDRSRDVRLRLTYTPPGEGQPVVEDFVLLTVFKSELIDARTFGPTAGGGLASPVTGAVPATAHVEGAVADGVSVLLSRLGTNAGWSLDTALALEVRHSRTAPAFTQTADFVGALSTAMPALPAPDPGRGVLGNVSLAFTSTQAKIAYFRPPNNFLFGRQLREEPLTLAVKQGNAVIFTRRLRLVRPTVMLAHGVTSNPGNMATLQAALTAAGRQVRVVTFDWSAQNTSGYDTIPLLLRTAIRQEIEFLRSTKIASTRVDYAGHSMGGVIAKWYVSNIPTTTLARRNGFPLLLWPGPNYLRADNFGAGDIRRLITFGSPLQGSPLADFISGQVGYNGVVAIVAQNPAWGGDTTAVDDLGVLSPATALLSRQRPTWISWYPIAGQAAPGRTEADQFGDILSDVLRTLGTSPSDLGLTPANSDTVVSLGSQVDAFNYPRPGVRSALVTSVVHKDEPHSPFVANHILRRLDLMFDDPVEGEPGHVQFNDGFP